ncbi:hypothetical protein [Streptomyces heilongjiangensis]|uniref:Conjugal transfer protein TraB n=1 Tax=Streptomyces heilongjiangensis TaxID=945052 RepID=A0ABW1BJK9_9ACTN|nr:hypothetical protein [Streptomyces heilongjiangensis]MDC2951091.1 hypothetical protein [Streptomyces heilongjiangensis]
MTAETVSPAAIPATVPAADVRPPLSATAARHLATVERIAYGAAGLTAAIGPGTDVWQLHAAALGTGVGVMCRLWSRARTREDGMTGLLTSCYKALPTLGLSAVYGVGIATPGTSWWEVTAAVAVALASAAAVPLTRSRGLRRAADNLPAVIASQEPQAPEQEGYAGDLARHWAASPATGTTALAHIAQYHPSRPDFEAVILAQPGEAIPGSLDARAIAGVFDVPEEAVKLARVPGHGPGRLAVQVAPAEHLDRQHLQDPGDHLAAVWAAKVAGPNGVAPGVELVDHRIEEDRVVMRVEAPESSLLALPRLPLARALGMQDPELLMIETDGMAQGVVTIYREHPLLTVREATVDDLRMDRNGRIAIGMRHDGRPARWPLYDTDLGALTDLLVGAPGSGKSVTLLTLLAAERINGVVSVVSDAQDGMSLPEAEGRVFHFGAGQAESAATLAAFFAVGAYRQEVSAANGWGSFTLGKPWRLAILTMDEINRMIAVDSGLPKDFRTWVAGMLGAGQITWRKVGMGVRIAGQSIHLADLGDSEKIRANAKNGSVWLGRVNSSMTRSMASDMSTGAVEITPIPKYFGVTGSAELDAAWSGDEAPTGPVTAGTAWLIQSGQPYLSRVWRAVKQERTYPGLIALMESAPLVDFTPQETDVFRRAYEEGLIVAMALLQGEDGTGAAPSPAPAGPTGAAADSGPSRVPAPPATARTLPDLVLDALAGGQLRTRDIRKAVGAGTEGGPSSGSVDNALTQLSERGLVVRVAHGVWTRADQAGPDES